MSFALFKYFKKRAPAIGRAATVALGVILDSDLPDEKKAAATETALKVATATENVLEAIKAGGSVITSDDDLKAIAGEIAALVVKYGLTVALKRAL